LQVYQRVYMKLIFALLIQEHKKFGQVLYPFMLEDGGKNYFNILDRISAANLKHYEDVLTPAQLSIVEITENYYDQEITRRFTNKNISARVFIEQTKPAYVANFIRPFIEKQMAKCIALAASEMIPIFYRETQQAVSKADLITAEPEPARIVFNFVKHPGETHYYQTISHLDTVIPLTGKNGCIMTNDPCWLLLDNRLFRFEEKVDGKKLQVFFNKQHIVVPERFEKEYYTTFVRNCIRVFPFHTEGIKIVELHSKKRAVLSLEYDLQGLPRLFLRLHYGNKSLNQYQKSKMLVNFTGTASEPSFEILRRDEAWEQHLEETLVRMGLQKSGDNNYIIDTGKNPEIQSGEYDLINWLNFNTAKLKEMGFEVMQEMGDKVYFTEFVQIVTEFEDKNDWFDIYAVVRFGSDFEVPLIKLRAHLIGGIREYVLPDGRIAVIPEEWFTKYSGLVIFGTKTGTGIRIHKSKYVLVQEAFDEKIKRSIKSLSQLRKEMMRVKPQLPDGLNAELRSYQKEGFQWFSFLRKHKLGGCLADDMGLGKTLQTITLLLHRKEKLTNTAALPDRLTASSGQLSLFDSIPEETFEGDPSLIIMPSSLIHNWENEIRKFAPGLSFLNYTGTQRSGLMKKFNRTNVILTTYGTIRNDFKELENFHFDYIILDESQVIKNPRSKTARSIMKLKADHRIALSGTPIENNLSDLWSQMNFLNRGLLGDHSFFKRFFATPIEKKNDQEQLRKLQILVKPLILRRTKAEVEKELPELNEDYVWCELTPEQELFYNKEKSSVRNFILESIEKEGISKTAIIMLQALTRLRQIANHPQLITPEYKHDSGKFEAVMHNIESLISGGHKVLMFSSFVKHLEIYAEHFDRHAVGYSMLTGQTRKRKEVISQFQHDEAKSVFLISLKAGGVGLNLTQAGYVFLLDPWWNPAAELQAISRSHRIGQTQHVFAYRYISAGTIEEKILRLQQKKSRLSELFIHPDNPLEHISVNELKELID
jgi:superfamily II DNA or RNA helicase